MKKSKHKRMGRNLNLRGSFAPSPTTFGRLLPLGLRNAYELLQTGSAPARATALVAELEVRVVMEFCPVGGGFIRDGYIVIDTEKDQHWIHPSYERATYLNNKHIRGRDLRNKCRGCGRANCASIQPLPSGRPTLPKYKVDEVLELYRKRIAAKPITLTDDDVGRSTPAVELSIKVCEIFKALQQNQPLPGDSHSAEVALALFYALKDLEDQRGHLQVGMKEVLNKWKERATEIGWPGNADVNECIEELKELSSPEPRVTDVSILHQVWKRRVQEGNFPKSVREVADRIGVHNMRPSGIVERLHTAEMLTAMEDVESRFFGGGW